MKCPLCEGFGFLKNIYGDKANIILKLHSKGLTYRQIMKVTGIKSTSHVSYYLAKSTSSSGEIAKGEGK
jgi:hypothetical protein